MNNAILVKNKNLISHITSCAFLFRKDKITPIRRRTTSFNWGHTEVTVASYSTFWKKKQNKKKKQSSIITTMIPLSVLRLCWGFVYRFFEKRCRKKQVTESFYLQMEQSIWLRPAELCIHFMTYHRFQTVFSRRSLAFLCLWPLCFLLVEALLNFICWNFILISTRDESFEIPVAFDNSTQALHLLHEW